MEKWIRLLGLRLHVSIGIHDSDLILGEEQNPELYAV